MGNGMNKVLPGLYVGSYRDARDQRQLTENGITHILSIHDNAKPHLPDKVYLCIGANDIDTQDLAQYFSQTNDFIHRCRLNGGQVLVHCLAGVSRSVTIATAYVMTVTGLGWRDSLNAVRGSRRCANPNFGFQRQLLNFQHEKLEKTLVYKCVQERQRLRECFAPSPFEESDLAECTRLLEVHTQWVYHGDKPAASGDEDKSLYPLGHNAYRQNSDDSSGKSEDPSPLITVTDDSELSQGSKNNFFCANGEMKVKSCEPSAEDLVDEIFEDSKKSGHAGKML